MIKRLFLWVFVFVIAWGVFATSLAYTPTSQDTANLTNLKWQLDNLIEDNNINLWDFYDQLKLLEINNSANERLFYMLANLKSYIYSKLFTLKTIDRVSSKSFKEEFLLEYDTWFTLEVDDSLANCTGWYNTLDDISFAYNFPTALTIATWYRESTCAYYLPSNGDGPFQIVDEDYGTWDMDEEQFIVAIEDFLEFANAKFDRYDGELSGSLSYTWFDMDGISNFAALYNWWTKSGSLILPNSTDYLFDGYGDEFSGAIRYGIFPQFIRALDWEIENTY